MFSDPMPESFKMTFWPGPPTHTTPPPSKMLLWESQTLRWECHVHLISKLVKVRAWCSKKYPLSDLSGSHFSSNILTLINWPEAPTQLPPPPPPLVVR